MEWKDPFRQQGEAVVAMRERLIFIEFERREGDVSHVAAQKLHQLVHNTG